MTLQGAHESPPARGRRPRVLHIITTLTTGGAERQLQGIAPLQHADVKVLALYEGGPVARAMSAAGIDVEVLGMDGWRKPLAWPRLARRVRALRPDVVHVHLLSAQLWGIPAARLAGVSRVISTEHSLMSDSMEERALSWWLRALYRILERLSDHTIAVSEETRARLQQWGVPPGRITVIDNGIDFEGCAYDSTGRTRCREEWGATPDVVVVGSVGRLAPAKRMHRLIEAVAPLLDATTVLVIAGDGDERARLERTAAELGVADHVRFLGSRSDMQAVLSGFDTLINASQDETFGMAVIEALANGLEVAYVECPALDALPDLPARCHPIPRHEGAQEIEALRRATEQLIAAARSEGGRGHGDRGAPDAVRKRYDLRRVAQSIDAVYAETAR